MDNKPDLYFRRRDKGATVFRVETGDTGRMEMQPIATVKPNGDIKDGGNFQPDETERARILDWIASQAALQIARDAARMDEMLGGINRFTHWVQTEAPDSLIVENFEPILFALHDLRTTLVRKIARNADSNRSD